MQIKWPLLIGYAAVISGVALALHNEGYRKPKLPPPVVTAPVTQPRPPAVDPVPLPVERPTVRPATAKRKTTIRSHRHAGKRTGRPLDIRSPAQRASMARISCRSIPTVAWRFDDATITAASKEHGLTDDQIAQVLACRPKGKRYGKR